MKLPGGFGKFFGRFGRGKKAGEEPRVVKTGGSRKFLLLTVSFVLFAAVLVYTGYRLGFFSKLRKTRLRTVSKVTFPKFRGFSAGLKKTVKQEKTAKQMVRQQGKEKKTQVPPAGHRMNFSQVKPESRKGFEPETKTPAAPVEQRVTQKTTTSPRKETGGTVNVDLLSLMNENLVRLRREIDRAKLELELAKLKAEIAKYKRVAAPPPPPPPPPKTICTKVKKAEEKREPPKPRFTYSPPPDFVVLSTLVGPMGSTAVVMLKNGRRLVVEEGSRIQGWKVEKIERDAVFFTNFAGKRYALPVTVNVERFDVVSYEKEERTRTGSTVVGIPGFYRGREK